jgi:hypothetical protein
LKKFSTFLVLLLLFQVVSAQKKDFEPKVTLKWAPTGLILGDASFQAEYGILKKSSLTVKLGVPFNRRFHANFDGHDVDMSMKAFSFLAGYRKYLSKHMLKGFYIEPFFTYVHHTSDGIGEGTLDNQPVKMDFTNGYNGTGIGIQLGSQFIIAKRLVIDLFFLGPQLTSSTNNFRAVDYTDSSTWSAIQADEAEQDIKNFLHQFPFIKNKTNVHVDTPNKTVTADYRGPLAGIRFGVSFGIAL